jgi:hypothetical protein
MSDEKTMGQVIQIDEARIRDHLGEMVGGTVEETLNAMLDAEADQQCGAGRYERSQTRQDTQAQYVEIAASIVIPGQEIGSFLVRGASNAANFDGSRGPDNEPRGNSGSNGNQDHTDNGKSGKPICCDVKSPSHPCKGNNGFGNGGDDGSSPNGFQDDTR